MAYQVEIKHSCRSSHRLMPPYKGKCNNNHGEYYTIILVIETNSLDENGMVIDFGIAKKILREWVDTNFDHAYICRKDDEVGEYLLSKGMRVYKMNDNPTAENMAKLVYDNLRIIIPNLKKVGVIESSPDSIAWYKPKERQTTLNDFKKEVKN